MAILLNNTFKYSIKSCIKDPDVGYIILELFIVNLMTVFLINIYAPNRDDPEWFSNHFEQVQVLIRGGGGGGGGVRMLVPCAKEFLQ